MSNQSLPVLKIIGASFRNSASMLKSIFVVFWPLLILGVAASYFSLISFTSVDHTGDGPLSGIIASILFFLFMVSFIPLTICWMEHVITKQPARFNFDKRMVPALGYSFLILIFLYAPILLLIFGLFALGKEAGMGTALGVTLMFAFIIYWVSTTMRFCLVLPAISVNNEKTRMSRSWSLTKGYQIKLLFAFMVPNLLISVPTNIVEKSVGTIIYDELSFILFMGGVIVSSIYGVLLFAEIAGRVFVFFHVPQKFNEYF